MLSGRQASGAPGDQSGFTLLELMIVMLVIGLMLAIAGGALISLENTSVRNDAMVADEQDASNTLAQMARDIRSAHSITFVASTSNAADSVVLNLNQPAGGTAPIEWVYQPPTAPAVVGTLSRVVLTSSLAVQSTRVVLTDVSNGSNAVFSYYNIKGGLAMSTSGSTANQTLQNCTTSIGVTLTIRPPTVSSVTPFTESDQIAITDQQQILSAPGNQQCGQYS